VKHITNTSARVEWRNKAYSEVKLINRNENHTANYSDARCGKLLPCAADIRNLQEGEKYIVYLIATRGGTEARSDPFEFYTRLNPSKDNHIS